MRRHLLATLSLLALACTAALPAAGPVSAADGARTHRIAVANIDPQLRPMLIDTKRQLNVMVELADQPVAAAVGDAKDSGAAVPTKAQRDTRRAQIATKQKPVADQIRKLGGRVVSELQDAYDGIHAHVPASAITTIAAMPNVVGIHAVPTYTPALTSTLPFIGAPQAWTDTGFSGSGVKVAVIDTGADFYHADYGGSGNPADYAYGLAHDTAAPAFNADGTTQAFPSAKIPVGYDFVGDAYDASATGDPSKTVPQPDGNPLDCNSHGTHTSSTVAGYGVLSNGATYHGAYNATTLSANSFKIGPGVAPSATLFIYKVFGCEGSTDVVVEAINRAVADGADVISMSLGSPFGPADSPDAIAANNAARAGVVVVASSGNEGSSAYMTGAPGAATRAISVAAIDSNASFPGATIQLASGAISALNANNGGPLPVTGRLTVLTSGGAIALGCAASDYAGVGPGDIVVTKRGVCARVDRATLGQAAGAAAVVMVNTDAGLPPFEGPINGVTIPFLGVPSTDGAALLAANGQTVTVAVASDLANPGFEKLASFSSYGPRVGDSAPKPDVTAPGVSVVAAGMGTGTGILVNSGTSMAAPHVAGVAALVVDAHPDWTVDQVKGAIVSTADASAAHILSYNPRGAGTGVVQAQLATTTAAMAVTPDHLESLAFGYRELAGAYRDTRSFLIRNTSSKPITYNLAAAFSGTSFGAGIAVSPSKVTVPGHGFRPVLVTLSLSASAVAALPDASVFTGLGPGAVADVRGLVTATPTASGQGIYPLHVQFALVPRGTSDVQVAAPATFKPAKGAVSATVGLKNRGIHAGTADVYAWGLTDKDHTAGSASARAVGVQTLPGSACDSSIPATDRCMIFAINNWHRWSNVGAAEWDVAIDTNNDGAPEFFVVGADEGAVLAGESDGIVASFTFDAKTGDLVDAFLADAPVNGSTILLPALASDLGLGSTAGTFAYEVTGFDLNTGAVDAVAGTARFDAFNPSVSNGQFFVLAPNKSASLTLSASPALLAKTPALGWMVVSLDNPTGAKQAATISLAKFLKP